MKKRNGAKQWPLGFGILYLMINFPFVIFVKIGITGVSASKRAKQVDEAAPGIPLPIMIIIIPFCYEAEQTLHAIFSPLRVSYYKGDGHTEWFLAVAGVPVFWLGVKYWIFVWSMFEIFINKI